jgi:hypothetical protein
MNNAKQGYLILEDYDPHKFCELKFLTGETVNIYPQETVVLFVEHEEIWS